MAGRAIQRRPRLGRGRSRRASSVLRRASADSTGLGADRQLAERSGRLFWCAWRVTSGTGAVDLEEPAGRFTGAGSPVPVDGEVEGREGPIAEETSDGHDLAIADVQHID